jgi:Fic family protein
MAKRGPSGKYLTVSSVGGERVRAFVPDELPPKPPLNVGPELRDRLDEALLALGRLDSVTTLLPDTHLFLYMYVRKEAVLSSQIEGTQSSLSDLLLFEAKETPGVPLDDVTEVSNYVAAMDHGLKRIRGDFPVSARLIREIHQVLMRRGRGDNKQPGEFRRTLNWIGGTRPGNAAFVPPPPEHLSDAIGALEKWIHDTPVRTPPLIKAALAHVQFETIHPFLDGNGRVGRLLVTLLFCAERVLSEPLLYMSLYLKHHRARYYDLLDAVRRNGAWEDWLEFFADGVRESATGAVDTVQRLKKQADRDREKVRSLGRTAGTALRVLDALQQRPVSNAAAIAKMSGVSQPSVNTSLASLEKLGIVRETTGGKRNRIFTYAKYLAMLSEGTEPIRAL